MPVILIFLVLIFYRVCFFGSGQPYAQEYACHMSIDVDLILNASLYYQQIISQLHFHMKIYALTPK